MFLAMEYVPGQTLREVMRAEGPLTPRAALDILAPVLQALAAAHKAGIIHRDVKPENIILREDDGTVKVADFGLARAVTTQTVTAQTGVLLGTVAYLSPEQVERGIADARSDVYAAGLILFEMLTGTKAFTGDTPIHIAYQHVHGSIPAPSSRVTTVPAELDALVALATSRDPDHRPSDAGDFLTEVRRSRAMLTPTELDRRPEGAAASGGGVNTVAVERTSALPMDRTDPSHRSGRSMPPVALPVEHTPTAPPPGPQEQDERRSAVADWPWRWLLAALAVALLAGLTAWYFLAGPGSPTVVPSTIGMTYAKARAALTARHLDPVKVDSFQESVPIGQVVATDPVAGRQVGRGTEVTVTVSKGPERYAVPDVVGKSQAEATDQLTATKLTLGTVTQAYSDTVPQGLVVSADPVVGTSLKRGAPVNLVVSKGRQPIPVTDFTGKPASMAVDALTTAGLKVDATQQENSDTVPKGSVIRQSPSGGSLYRGDQVTLVVSKGPVMVAVPDVTGKQADEAQKILEAAGFQVQRQTVLGGLFGTVHHTDPAAGSQAPKGSTVVMVIV
jgi:serine/threonine-protein kinase